MANNKTLILKSGWVLGLFSLIGIGLVSFTHSVTHEKIADNERLFILKNLRELVPETLHDNDLLEDPIQIVDANAFGNQHEVTIYKAVKNKQLVAVIASPTAADGYNGSIKLLVAIRENGELMGVRVVSHHETPGLGDAIDTIRVTGCTVLMGALSTTQKHGYGRLKKMVVTLTNLPAQQLRHEQSSKPC